MEQYQIDDIKTNLRSYLESQGINTSRHFKCINPNHFEKNASMKYYDDNKVYCFGCGMTYNLIDVIGIMENCSNKEAFKKAIQYYGNNHTPPTKIANATKSAQNKDNKKVIRNYEKAFDLWQKNLNSSIEAQNYLKSRGIDMQTANRFHLGFNKFDFKKFILNAVIIPTSKNSYTARNIYENGEIKYYKTKKYEAQLLNPEALTNHFPYCVITEGEFDCLSFETIGINCVGLCSANYVSKLLEKELDKNKTYILAFDNDFAGERATNEIIDYFKNNNILYTTFNNCGYKDANEALVKDRENFIKNIKKIVETLTETNCSIKKDAEM